MGNTPTGFSSEPSTPGDATPKQRSHTLSVSSPKSKKNHWVPTSPYLFPNTGRSLPHRNTYEPNSPTKLSRTHRQRGSAAQTCIGNRAPAKNGAQQNLTISSPLFCEYNKEKGENGIPILEKSCIEGISQYFENNTDLSTVHKHETLGAYWLKTNNNVQIIIPNMDTLYIKDIRQEVEKNITDEEKQKYGADYLEKEIRNQELKKLLFSQQSDTIPSPLTKTNTTPVYQRDYDGQEKRKKELDTLRALIEKLCRTYGYTFEITPQEAHSNIRTLNIFPFSNLIVLHISLPDTVFPSPFSEFIHKPKELKKLELHIRGSVSEATNVPLEEVVFLQLNNTHTCLVSFNINMLTIPKDSTSFWEQIKNNIAQSLGAKTQIIEVILRQNIKISKFDFDPVGDMEFLFGTGDTQLRGGLVYKQPDNQWKRYGLKIAYLYDNMDWISMDGNCNEWAGGYHGPIHLPAGKETGKPGKVFKIDKENGTYIEQNTTVPDGIYLSKDVEKCFFQVELNGKNYHIALQCRIHPEHAFIPDSNTDCIVVDSPVYVRPCGIVLKYTGGKTLTQKISEADTSDLESSWEVIDGMN